MGMRDIGRQARLGAGGGHKVCDVAVQREYLLTVDLLEEHSVAHGSTVVVGSRRPTSF